MRAGWAVCAAAMVAVVVAPLGSRAFVFPSNTGVARRPARGGPPLRHGLKTLEPAPAPTSSDRVISLTARAEAHIERMRQDRAYVRVAVVAGDGCAKLSYTMDFCDAPATHDVVEPFSTFSVLVDAASLQFLSGCEIGYSDDLKDGGLTFTNPNARTACNCGKSFNV